MPEFISSTCPACSTSLKIPSKLTRLSCGTCGNEFNVKQDGGIVFLEPVGKELKKLVVNTDKTASELAIRRLTSEIETLDNEIIRLRFVLKGNWHPLMARYFEETLGMKNISKIDNFKYTWGLLSYRRYWSEEIDNLSLKQTEDLITILLPYIDHPKALTKAPEDLSTREIIDTLKHLAQLLQNLEQRQSELNHHKQIVQKL